MKAVELKPDEVSIYREAFEALDLITDMCANVRLMTEVLRELIQKQRKKN